MIFVYFYCRRHNDELLTPLMRILLNENRSSDFKGIWKQNPLLRSQRSTVPAYEYCSLIVGIAPMHILESLSELDRGYLSVV